MRYRCYCDTAAVILSLSTHRKSCGILSVCHPFPFDHLYQLEGIVDTTVNSYAILAISLQCH